MEKAICIEHMRTTNQKHDFFFISFLFRLKRRSFGPKLTDDVWETDCGKARVEYNNFKQFKAWLIVVVYCEWHVISAHINYWVFFFCLLCVCGMNSFLADV